VLNGARAFKTTASKLEAASEAAPPPDGPRLAAAGQQEKPPAGSTVFADPTAQNDDSELRGPAASSAVRGKTSTAAGVPVAAPPQAATAEGQESPQTAVSAATAALREGRPDVAIALLKTAEERFPESAAIHRTLGVAYYRAGDYRASQVALQQALSLDKACALSYFLMGCTLAKIGQQEAAETNFRQAQLIDPRYTRPR
jgi:tetratricopeptide (TPR) repeat protein